MCNVPLERAVLPIWRSQEYPDEIILENYPNQSISDGCVIKAMSGNPGEIKVSKRSSRF